MKAGVDSCVWQLHQKRPQQHCCCFVVCVAVAVAVVVLLVVFLVAVSHLLWIIYLNGMVVSYF